MARDAFSLNKEEQSTGPVARYNNANTPRTETYYAPKYKMLNYTTWQTDVSGRVNYAMVVGKTAQGAIDRIQKSLEEETLVNTYNGINQQLTREAAEFKRNSETGEGYLEFISNKHAELSSQAMKGIINPFFASRMRTMLAKSKADWTNGAFEEEQSMKASAALLKSREAINDLCIGVFNNPFTYESGRQAMENALEGYKQVAGVQAFNKEYANSLKTFTHAYGLGLVEQDPANFEALAKDGRLNVLGADQLMSLRRAAKQEMHAQAAIAEREGEQAEIVSDARDIVSSVLMRSFIEENGGEGITETAIQSAIQSPEMQEQVKEFQQQIIEQDKRERKQLLKMGKAALEGDISGFSKDLQRQWIDMEYNAIVGLNGKNSRSINDYIKLMNGVKANFTDTTKKQEAMNAIIYSPNIDEKKMWAEAIVNAQQSGNKLFGSRDKGLTPKEKYLVGLVNSSTPETMIKAVETANKYFSTIEQDPMRAKEIKNSAAEYAKSQEYKDLRKRSAERALEESGIGTGQIVQADPDSWKGFTFGATAEQAKGEKDFNRLFDADVKDLVAHGWQPEEAADYVVSRFKTLYSKSKFAGGKSMWRAPEMQYPQLSVKDLDSRLKFAVNSAIKYNGKAKYAPLGYSIVGFENGNIHAKTAKGNTISSKLILEWAPERRAYAMYFETPSKNKIYLSTPGGQMFMNFEDSAIVNAIAKERKEKKQEAKK